MVIRRRLGLPLSLVNFDGKHMPRASASSAKEIEEGLSVVTNKLDAPLSWLTKVNVRICAFSCYSESSGISQLIVTPKEKKHLDKLAEVETKKSNDYWRNRPQPVVRFTAVLHKCSRFGSFSQDGSCTEEARRWFKCESRAKGSEPTAEESANSPYDTKVHFVYLCRER